jgi:diguanylate cyclase (GGDEF)-like protein
MPKWFGIASSQRLRLPATGSSVMHSLFDALLAQHGRQLTPVRCAHSTIAQLHRYFEDVVLENNLSALVIECLPLAARRSPREIARVRDLARRGRRTFFFVGQTDELNNSIDHAGVGGTFAPVFLQHVRPEHASEHFVVIADARFSALLATVHTNSNNEKPGEDEVVWTFEPDIVYSALEYLMARIRAEHPYHSTVLGSAVRTSMPKATSLQLTLSVTTKLAHLLQEQAGREIAVNRIATAIRESLEVGAILQKTVTEVGAALNVACCALRVLDQTEVQAVNYSYFADAEKETKLQRDEVMRELDTITSQLATNQELFSRDGSESTEAGHVAFPLAVVPLVFQQRFIGALEVVDDQPARTWQDNEILLLRTVANQVAVAINHADLYAQIKQQALTDPLTGCYNRRLFEMHLERDLQMATRTHQPVSLLMLDLDRFKQLNDSAGHDAGDSALRKLADCLRQVVRAVDTAARFGGDEFALILPHAYSEGALIVAERLRSQIEKIEIPGFGHLAASIGIASFPMHASSPAELMVAADAALYLAKRGGRNRVAVFDVTCASGDGALLPTGGELQETVEHHM